MRKSILSILNSFKAIVFAAGLGTALVGGAAHAESVTERVLAEMNKGKDYNAAWQTAMRAVGSGYSPDLIVVAKSAERHLDEGKDYSDAWAAAERPLPAALREHVKDLAKRDEFYWRGRAPF